MHNYDISKSLFKLIPLPGILSSPKGYMFPFLRKSISRKKKKFTLLLERRILVFSLKLSKADSEKIRL
jgi:hypothetical protein